MRGEDLKMSYEEFYEKHKYYSRLDGGSYDYCVSKEDDSEEERQSYLNYIQEKRRSGFIR